LRENNRKNTKTEVHVYMYGKNKTETKKFLTIKRNNVKILTVWRSHRLDILVIIEGSQSVGGQGNADKLIPTKHLSSVKIP